jgi:hypothetical protein
MVNVITVSVFVMIVGLVQSVNF